MKSEIPPQVLGSSRPEPSDIGLVGRSCCSDAVSESVFWLGGCGIVSVLFATFRCSFNFRSNFLEIQIQLQIQKQILGHVSSDAASNSDSVSGKSQFIIFLQILRIHYSDVASNSNANSDNCVRLAAVLPCRWKLLPACLLRSSAWPGSPSRCTL